MYISYGRTIELVSFLHEVTTMASSSFFQMRASGDGAPLLLSGFILWYSICSSSRRRWWVWLVCFRALSCFFLDSTLCSSVVRAVWERTCTSVWERTRDRHDDSEPEKESCIIIFILLCYFFRHQTENFVYFKCCYCILLVPTVVQLGLAAANPVVK